MIDPGAEVGRYSPDSSVRLHNNNRYRTSLIVFSETVSIVVLSLPGVVERPHKYLNHLQIRLFNNEQSFSPGPTYRVSSCQMTRIHYRCW